MPSFAPLPLLPNASAILTLAPHRILPLRNDKLAVLAERHTGWFLTTSIGYSAICELFDGTRNVSDFGDSSIQAIANQLWNSGLLLADQQPHPDTLTQNEIYPSSLLLKLTGACNLDCTYCYDYETTRFKANLSLDRIEEILRFLLSHRNSLSIVFHGGEPLLRFALLKDVVKLAQEIAGDKQRLSFSIQTNALLLNDEIVSFFENNGFSVGISLDGIVDEANSLRIFRNGKGSTEKIRSLLARYDSFVRSYCGVLAVVSKTSVRLLPKFALWLQDVGINSLTVSFLDTTGRGQNLNKEKLTPQQAVELYDRLLEMIQNKEIEALAIRSLISRIENLFTFQPRDFCHKGPCAAASDFLVLDAEGALRSCDCVYDPYFMLADKQESPFRILNNPQRNAVVERHDWLREKGKECHSCALFGLCGGTCVAKAIANHNEPLDIDPIECALSKFIYPKLLEELSSSDDSQVIRYYEYHRFQSKFNLS